VTLHPPARVSSLHGLPGFYIGETVGIASLGHGSVAMAWAVRQNVSGNLTVGVDDVVAKFG